MITDQETLAKVIRVYYEGNHPLEGHVSVLQLMWKDNGEICQCFMRIFHSPDHFTIGEEIGICNDDAVRDPRRSRTGINRVGDTFVDYKGPGKIFSGG